MDLSIKSIGFLIDELITTDMKCYMAQEIMKDKDVSMEELGKMFIRVQELNDRRNKLIVTIDKRLGDSEISPTTKTYHSYLEEKK